MAEKCAGKVWGSYDWGSCSYTGKTEEGGKLWCGIHLPSRIAAKRKALEDKWQADRDAREARIAADQAEAAERDRRAALFPKLRTALADCAVDRHRLAGHAGYFSDCDDTECTALRATLEKADHD